MNQNARTNQTAANDFEPDDLRIRTTRRDPRLGGAGVWATASVAGHEFEALIFPGHAENPAYEVGGDSRISKLWVKRLADGAVVYNWDRGLDVPPANALAAAVADYPGRRAGRARVPQRRSLNPQRRRYERDANDIDQGKPRDHRRSRS